MKQIQKTGTVFEDAQGVKYKDVIVLPHAQKINPNGSLFLQAAFYFDEDALDDEPFYIFSILFDKEPEIENFVAKYDENGTVLLDDEGTPVMDFEKTTFVHIGAPRIVQNLHHLYPVDNPLAFSPKNRASQLFWNNLEFAPIWAPGLKFGDIFEYENGLLPE